MHSAGTNAGSTPRSGSVPRSARARAAFAASLHSWRFEVAGQNEDEALLLDKAQWYLAHGVTIVWLVLPETREVVVLIGEQETRYRMGQRLAPHDALPDLAPGVADFFRSCDPDAARSLHKR